MADKTIIDSKAQTFGPAAIIAIIVGVIVTIVKAFIWSKGNFNAQVVGYALAGALIPGAIAYAIGGRQKTGSPNKFALWFLLLSILFLLLETRQ